MKAVHKYIVYLLLVIIVILGIVLYKEGFCSIQNTLNASKITGDQTSWQQYTNTFNSTVDHIVKRAYETEEGASTYQTSAPYIVRRKDGTKLGSLNDCCGGYLTKGTDTGTIEYVCD